MKIGVAVPTCMEGLMLPQPFGGIDELLALFSELERLGYDSAWGNDHITAPQYVREEHAEPPRFFEPLTVFAAASQHTERLRLCTAILVLPMRDPVYLAKQLATLDLVSGGRVIAGIGTGAYREEFERSNPRRQGAKRGAMLDEGLVALRALLSGERVSHDGEHYAFDGLQLHPRPWQDPFPLYIGGNADQAIERAARHGQGWLPGAPGLDYLSRGVARLRSRAAEYGRDPDEIEVAPQYLCCIAKTREQALRRFRASAVYVHLKTLARSTLSGQRLEDVEAANLVGSPEDIVEQIERLREHGATYLAATAFVSDDPRSMVDDLQWFSEDVMRRVSRGVGLT